MFKKILIANRGEIACRVMRSAQKMGIKTVAVYSEADAEALHVRLADEKVCVGPAASAQSYLVIENIVKACKDTGAEAVHPGYGFLSENRAFAKALADEGIAFIGPNELAIQAMGDKIESKKLAKKAGVSTVPGYVGEIADADQAVQIANDIGYPVMIKASAGGGGKGMRVANDEQEAREGFQLARNEAKSSFGDDRIFIEKFITQPRHIEIQVLADTKGNTLYLAERECSVQRRHQKVLEEAPSPFLDDATRKAMGEQAVALAKAVDYRSAGTVEFIVDGDRNFYFLEMNTRLQVEHPVTELITGIDLVEWMIRIAAGETLTLKQDDIKINGWAMEARVYAEDPLRNFLPSIGRLTRYAEPEGDGIRCDSGVFEGSEISMFYDPMIAKLISHGSHRNHAIDRLRKALDSYVIRGLNHNIPFLSACMAKTRYREGNLTTNFIAEEFPNGFQGVQPSVDECERLAAVIAAVHFREALRDTTITGQLSGHEMHASRDWIVKMAGHRYDITIEEHENGDLVTVIGDRKRVVQTPWTPGNILLTGQVDGEEIAVQIDIDGIGYKLFHDGVEVDALVLTPRQAALHDLMPVKQPPDMSKYLLSPMPGLLLRLAVSEGEEVKSGQELAVVEAMKMENILRAERDGTILKINAEPGASLAVDEIILEFS